MGFVRNPQQVSLLLLYNQITMRYTRCPFISLRLVRRFSGGPDHIQKYAYIVLSRKPNKLKSAPELICAREQKPYENYISLLTDIQLGFFMAVARQGGKSYRRSAPMSRFPLTSICIESTMLTCYDPKEVSKEGDYL